MRFKARRMISLVAGFLLLVLLNAAVVSAGGNEPPRAVQGLVDASLYDYDRGMIRLNGEWEFYWSQLLDPESFHEGRPGQAMYLPVPKSWEDKTFGGQSMSNYGYATYRLTVRLDEQSSGRQMGIYMPSVATSYKLWINGRLRAENGIVGRTPEEMVPKNYRKAIYFEPEGRDVELIIQVANFVQRKGGLWETIRLGTAEQIAYERDKNIVTQMFVIGSLTIMGLYHFGIYLFRRKDKSSLYFGAVCLSVALRAFVLGETLLVRLLPGLDWELVVKVEYWAGALTLPFFLFYCYHQYPQELRKSWIGAASILAVVCCLIVLFTKARTYTYLMPYYSIFFLLMLLYATYGLFMAAMRRRDGAKLNFVALLIFFATVLNDILFYNHLIYSNEMISFGLLLYLFVQSFLLSTTFSRAFIHSERLSEELLELNESLEEKVRERTVELEVSNGKLQKANHEMALMESSRRSLLSNISHELRTPLTSIQGYVQALLDGVIQENRTKYLELINQKAQLLDHIFRDLLELSKLEARKIEFQYKPLPAKALVRRLFDKYEWDVRSKGLHVEIVEPVEPVPGYRSMVKADFVRLEQVFANLLSNAVKFTPAGGSVCVHSVLAEQTPNEYRLVVNVTDTGPGIAEEEAGLVFDRFYRGKNHRKAQAGGVGLGLSISKEIIDYHKGNIGVESRPGAGSTFYFALPVTFVSVDSDSDTA